MYINFGKMRQQRKPPKERTQSACLQAHPISDQDAAQSSTVEDRGAGPLAAADLESDSAEMEGDHTSCSPTAGALVGSGKPAIEVQHLKRKAKPVVTSMNAVQVVKAILMSVSVVLSLNNETK